VWKGRNMDIKDPSTRAKKEKLGSNESRAGQKGLVLCFITSYPPNKARLSEYAYNLLNKLAKLPTIEKIYVLADKASKRGRNRSSKVEIRSVWSHDNPISIFKMLFEILKVKPDLVHYNVHFQSFGRSRIANFVGLCLPFFTRLLGRKTLVTIHNFGEKVDLEKCGLKPSIINRIGIRIATKLISMANLVTVTVSSYINYLRRNYGCDRVVYIPHGTYVDAFNAGLNSDPPHKNRKKVILMFGHMAPYKGLTILMDVFQEISKEREDVELVIAGDDHPNFPGYLESQKRDVPGIKYLGYVPEEDVPAVFKEAFMVVLPYLTATGTSGVFHLACGFGKPIIVSDLPEIRELIKEGASAIIVPPGDAEELKKAILMLLDNQHLAEKIGRINLNFAQKESWDIIAKRFTETYCLLANGMNGPQIISKISSS